MESKKKLILTTGDIRSLRIWYNQVLLTFENIPDEINEIILNKYDETLSKMYTIEKETTYYSLDEYMQLKHNLEKQDKRFKEIDERKLQEPDDFIFEKRRESSVKSKTSLLDVESPKVSNVLYENINKNIFLKKEVLFISLMAGFLIFYLFALNDWKNVIAFTTMFLTLGLVSAKLYRIFVNRVKTYEDLIIDVNTKLSTKKKYSKVKQDFDDVSNYFDSANESIEELLSRRAGLRKTQLKDWNYEFDKNKNNPAYRRQEIDISNNEDWEKDYSDERGNSSFL